MPSFAPRRIWAELAVARTTDGEAYYYAQDERTFIASEELPNASKGDATNLHIRNPSGSGVTVVFHEVEAGPTTRSYGRVYESFDTEPTAGDPAQIQNWLADAEDGTDDPDAGVAEAYTDSTFDASEPHYSSPLAGGAGGQSVGGSSDFPILAIEPGRDAVIQVEKLVSGPDENAITAVWYEIPAVFSEENMDPRIDEVA